MVTENRNRQAWLILILFLLLHAILGPSIEHLFSRQMAEQYGVPLQWLLLAWTAVWLLSPWLVRRKPAIAIVLVFGVAAAVAAAGTFGGSGRFVSSMLLADYAVWVFALTSAFLLTRECCRKSYSPRRFLTWLALWLILSVAVGLACEVVWFLLPRLIGKQMDWSTALNLLPRIGIGCLMEAIALYVLNLPFMCLAFWCPTYRDRFHGLLHLSRYQVPATPAADTHVIDAAGLTRS